MADVCVTIDVEDFFLPRPATDTIFAEFGGEEWGIGRIMSVLEEFGARGTFYIDVLNRVTLTEDILRRACREVVARGHELGLHTHPEFPEGRRGYGMAQVMSNHSPDEQLRIVEKCVRLIERWTESRPITHRAGGYGANAATLAALVANGFTTDSSLLPHYSGSQLAAEFPAINVCFDHEGIREIPVTVTSNRFGVPLPGCRWAGLSLPMKIDIDWLDLHALKDQVSAAIEQTDAPVVIFMHSYTFLDIERGFAPNPANVAKLRGLLSWFLGRGDISLLGISEAGVRAKVHSLPAAVLPVCSFNFLRHPILWARYAMRSISVDRIRKLVRQKASSG